MFLRNGWGFYVKYSYPFKNSALSCENSLILFVYTDIRTYIHAYDYTLILSALITVQA